MKANQRLGVKGKKDALRQTDDGKNHNRFDRYFKNQSKRFVYHLNPFRLNERITAQQGVFLAHGDVKNSFEVNLRALDLHSSAWQTIEIAKSCRQEVLLELRRMNISRATLSPGLDGFAQSLGTFAANRKLILAQREFD